MVVTSTPRSSFSEGSVLIDLCYFQLITSWRNTLETKRAPHLALIVAVGIVVHSSHTCQAAIRQRDRSRGRRLQLTSSSPACFVGLRRASRPARLFRRRASSQLISRGCDVAFLNPSICVVRAEKHRQRQ